MSFLTATQHDVYWTAEKNGIIQDTGVLTIGGELGVPSDLIVVASESLGDFLASLKGKIMINSPLPEVGQYCGAGMLYFHEGVFIFCTASHIREDVPPTDPAYFKTVTP